MKLLRSVLNRFPALKAVARKLYHLRPGGSVSTNYVELAGNEAESEAERLASSWQDPSLPQRQRALVENQLAAYARGERIDTFDVMRAALDDLKMTNGPVSLLEVGCSSGYYSEVISPLNPGFVYSGCDYSPAFIDMARQRYPALQFAVADATDLAYGDEAFDVVVSGCCLLHIPNYGKAIAETARVARDYAIFHRTPVVIGQPEKTFRKHAYGVETVEIHFNEQAFLQDLHRNGLTLLKTYSLSEDIHNNVGSAVRTYVCRKTKKVESAL